MSKKKLSNEIIKRSLVNKGDISRILKLYEKISEGKDITIAFLGGSITQGCHSTVYEKCYVELVAKWFRKKFINVNVKHINAGVGATGSLIGVHRADMQVLSQNPDLIFVDAAVNDNDSEYCKVSYESEIRKLLSNKNKPAVIEVFMTMENGVNYQEQEIEVGNRYDVPMISYRNAALEIIKQKNLKWCDLLTDEVHPNDYGHWIISEILIDFLEKTFEEDYDENQTIEVIDDTLEKPCVFGDRYIDGRIVNNINTEVLENKNFKNYDEGFQVFQNGWKFEGDANENGRLVLEVEAKNIILLYKKVISKNSGKFTVKVNNKKVAYIDTYFKKGWGDYSATEILEESNIIKKYKIEIDIENEERKREVIILGILIS